MTSPPLTDYSSEFDILDHKCRHKIFCCQSIKPADGKYVMKEDMPKRDIQYFVERRCGNGKDGPGYPDTTDMEDMEELDPDYCFCVIEVEVTRNDDLAGVNDSAKVTDKSAYDPEFSGVVDDKDQSLNHNLDRFNKTGKNRQPNTSPIKKSSNPGTQVTPPVQAASPYVNSNMLGSKEARTSPTGTVAGPKANPVRRRNNARSQVDNLVQPTNENPSMQVTIPAKRRFYAVYESEFYPSGRVLRRDGMRAGVVHEISKRKLDRSIAANAVSVNDEAGRVTRSQTIYTLKNQREVDGGHDGTFNMDKLMEGACRKSDKPQYQGPKYQLIFSEEGDFRCAAHRKLQFRVKLYQWGAVLGSDTPNHHSLGRESNGLIDIFSDPLHRHYRPGLEIRLVHETANTQLPN